MEKERSNSDELGHDSEMAKASYERNCVSQILEHKGRTTLQKFKVIESVNCRFTAGPAIIGSVADEGLDVLDGTPLNWPQGIAWKPKRYFGPFWTGSTLEQIEIRIEGTSATWYYNDFFATNPDVQRYKPFYPGNITPSDITPGKDYCPGLVPTYEGAGVLDFMLGRISYSSRYGGTVALHFTLKDNVGFEIRSGSLMWDINHLGLTVYVAPSKSGLNSPQTAYNYGCVTLEFRPYGITAYNIPTMPGYNTPGTNLTALPDPHVSDLEQALTTIANGVVNNLEQPARRFVGGFLNSQFQDLIVVGTIVDKINIADNYIDIYTSQGEPVVSVIFRACNIRFQIGEHDPRLTLDSFHIYNGGFINKPGKTFDLEEGEDTGFVSAGMWTLDEVNNISQIVLRVSGVDVDWWSDDDPYHTVEIDLQLDYDQLLAAHQNQGYGYIETLVFDSFAHSVDGVFQGVGFDVVVLVSLNLR